MAPLTHGEITYPARPPSRLPAPIWVPLAVVAVLLGSGVPLLLGWLLYEVYGWSGPAATGAGLAAAVVLLAGLLTPLAWGRLPRGGLPATFRLPLPLRLLVWVAALLVPWVGVLGAAVWLVMVAGWPEIATGLMAVPALVVGLGGAGAIATKLCQPVEGSAVLTWHLRPRGTFPDEPSAAEIATITGRAVMDAVRLEEDGTIRSATPRWALGAVRYELAHGDYLDLLFSGVTSAQRFFQRLGTGDRVPVPDLGEAAYLVRQAGGPDRLAVWLRDDLGGIVVTGSRQYDAAILARVAAAAAQARQRFAEDRKRVV